MTDETIRRGDYTDLDKLDNEVSVTEYKESVIVAHPLQQHSYRLAVALRKKELLHSYCTTIYYKPKKILYRLLNIILGTNNDQRMKGRQNILIENKVKQFDELLGLFFLFVLRIDKKKIIEPYIYKYLTSRFGKDVARYAIQRKAKAIIIYDTTGLSCFEALDKENKIIKVLDMSSGAAAYIVKIINKDKDRAHAFISSHECKMKTLSNKVVENYTKEILLADYFLVPSAFVQKSLLDLGIQKEQIFLAPYGVDINKFSIKPFSQYMQSNPIRFLFVGRLEAAKGIFYLLEAVKQINRDDIQLLLVGYMQGQENLFKTYKRHFTYLGTKLAHEMPDVYKKADVFIFPSLFEGFSLSVIEAMASGLPVIASDNSGANDIIADGEEGFIVPIMDIEALKEKIIWFCDHKERIKHMGENSRKTAERYTWDQYEEKVAKIVSDIVNY